MLLLSLVLGIGIFFLLPAVCWPRPLRLSSGRGLGLQLSEGVIRVAIFVGLPPADVSNGWTWPATFQYHGPSTCRFTPGKPAIR